MTDKTEVEVEATPEEKEPKEEEEAEKEAPAKTTKREKKQKAPKKEKKVTVKKVPTHPKYDDMISAAISTLKERGGSSRQSILKYINTTYKINTKPSHQLKLALRRGVENGFLIQVKGTGASGSFKLAKKGDSEPAKPKPAAKKSPKKKATPKKPKTAPKKAKKSPKKPAAAKKPVAKKAEKPAPTGRRGRSSDE